MSFERVVRCFQDIVEAAELITTWTDRAGGPEGAIFRDEQVRSAIERQFLIISEAASRLDKLDPSITLELAPEIDWAGIRGIGNFLRHRYDDLDKSVLVDVVENRLATLTEVCTRCVVRLQAF